MALRIGKKNQDADWSDESLRQELAQISEQPGETQSTSATSGDPLAGVYEDASAGNTASTPAASDAPRRPRISPVLLAAGLVFLIVAGGVGAYLAFFSTPPEDESAPVIAARPPRASTPPARPGVPPPATSVVRTSPAAPANSKTTAPAPATAKKTAPTPVPKAKVVPPKTPVKRVTPGKAGIAAKNAKPPAVAPKAPGQAPRVVPVQGVPTPVVPPPGMAGQAGKGSSRVTTVQVVRPVEALTPAVAQQLKALWNQGAAAKHRGDYAGARRAWQQILRIRPGHPGIQEAINKLPNR